MLRHRNSIHRTEPSQTAALSNRILLACLCAYRKVKDLTMTNRMRAIRAIAPAFFALSLATVAHAQGTMDFSGATTLMTTFKTLTAFLRRADEGTLSRLLVEASILLAASRGNATTILKDAATAYKVDTEAIATKVRQEFAAKAKAKPVSKPSPKVKKAA
jgi:ParB family chromosome partitioning protein